MAELRTNNLQKGMLGPMRLYVGSLHFNITEEMLRGIFEPFGRIESIQLMTDGDTGHSKGYGFITFADGECAKKALEQLNGFELAGRPMKVGHVTERIDASAASSFLDNDELDRSGIDLGTTGRLQLMARLAEALLPDWLMSTFVCVAAAAAMNPALNMNSGALNLPSQPLATHCFQLSNMFSPSR
uniref:RRM domain-containing protein n=1 Tax=Mola mola TaxID=94237 RepID=A0A3Q3WY11_MOLML